MDRMPRSRTASSGDPTFSLAERLALYVFGVAWVIAFFMESPVPMVIAP